MASPVDLVNDAAVSATGLVAFTTPSGTLQKVPSRGHDTWALTSDKDDAGAATVLLKGTNNPDPSDTDGETLITNTHSGSDQQDGSVTGKAYKYVFVHVTSIAAGDFDADSGIRLYGTGNW